MDCIAFLWDWNENWPFRILWPPLSFPNLLTYWVQHFHSSAFRVWNSWNSITYTSLVMLPKGHLTPPSVVIFTENTSLNLLFAIYLPTRVWQRWKAERGGGGRQRHMGAGDESPRHAFLIVPLEHKNLTFVQFPDTGCHYRMPKYPEEKFAVPLIIQMFSPFKCWTSGYPCPYRWLAEADPFHLVVWHEKNAVPWEGFCMYVMICQVG